MKLIRVERIINSQTYAPEIKVTLSFPIEFVIDSKDMVNDDEMAKALGHELIFLMRKLDDRSK